VLNDTNNNFSHLVNQFFQSIQCIAVSVDTQTDRQTDIHATRNLLTAWF